MRIAYTRFNQYCELDYAVGSVSSLGTELRAGILQALVELGHNVTLLTPISDKHMHALKGISKGDFDNSWMTSLHYDIRADVQQFDVIIVETAALNSMYRFKFDGEHISFIQHFADILYEAKGVPVVIYQHGPKSLAFPFWRLAHQMDNFTGNLENLAETNYRRIFDFDILDGYDYYVWHHAPDDELFKTHYKDYMFLDSSRLVGTPVSYSPTYDKLYMPRSFEEALYDLMFVGRASTPYRIQRIKQFYDIDVDVAVIGAGWEDVDFHHTIYTPGKVGYHGDCQNLYLQAQACVLIANEEIAKTGLATTRHIQTIRSGTFTMIDGDIVYPEWWMGTDEFVVRDGSDVITMLNKYCDNYEELQSVMHYQQSMLKSWVATVPIMLDKVSQGGC